MPEAMTPGRWETLTAHRPDLALWLQHQRDAAGGSDMDPDVRADLEERAFHAAGNELVSVLSQMTEAGDLRNGTEALHVAGRD